MWQNNQRNQMFVKNIRDNKFTVHMRDGYLCFEGEIMVTPIWYRINPLSDTWQWSPDLINWMNCLVAKPHKVSHGKWKGQEPATCNIEIIEYLAKNNASLPRNPLWVRSQPLKEVERVAILQFELTKKEQEINQLTIMQQKQIQKKNKQIQRLIEKNKKFQKEIGYQNQGLCKICYDKAAEYSNKNCGHLCVCEQHSKLSKCPLCNSEGDFIRIFFSRIGK